MVGGHGWRGEDSALGFLSQGLPSLRPGFAQEARSGLSPGISVFLGHRQSLLSLAEWLLHSLTWPCLRPQRVLTQGESQGLRPGRSFLSQWVGGRCRRPAGKWGWGCFSVCVFSCLFFLNVCVCVCIQAVTKTMYRYIVTTGFFSSSSRELKLTL